MRFWHQQSHLFECPDMEVRKILPIQIQVRLNHQKVVAYISLSCNDFIRSIKNNAMQNEGTYPNFILLFSPFSPLLVSMDYPHFFFSWMSQIHSLLLLSCQIRHHILSEFFLCLCFLLSLGSISIPNSPQTAPIFEYTEYRCPNHVLNPRVRYQTVHFQSLGSSLLAIFWCL